MSFSDSDETVAPRNNFRGEFFPLNFGIYIFLSPSSHYADHKKPISPLLGIIASEYPFTKFCIGGCCAFDLVVLAGFLWKDIWQRC